MSSSHIVSTRTGQVLGHLSSLSATQQYMAFPETIQAIAINEQGDLDVMEKKTLPFPTQAPGQVIIKVSAAFWI